MTTPLLGLPEITANQNQKEVTANKALNMLEAALNDSLTHSLASGNLTLSSQQFQRYFLHRMQGHSVPRVLTVPATKRTFAVTNEGTGQLTVQVSGGSSTILDTGQSGVLNTDGSSVFPLAVVGESVTAPELDFTDLVDVPASLSGQALKYLRVKADESGLEFTEDTAVALGTPDLSTEYTTTPPTAPANGITLYTLNRGGRNRLAVRDPDGGNYELQPALWNGNFVLWRNATALGMNFTAAGTASTPSFSTGTYFGSTRRTRYTSSASTGAVGGIRGDTLAFKRGAGADSFGGFEFIARFGIGTNQTNSRVFVGLVGTTSALVGSSDYSGQLVATGGAFGLCKNAADTNFRLVAADGTTLSQVDFGSSYPANTSATDLYEFRLYCPKNGNVGYSLHRLNTGALAEGTLSSNLPTSQYLAPHAVMTTGAGSAAVAIDLITLWAFSEI